MVVVVVGCFFFCSCLYFVYIFVILLLEAMPIPAVQHTPHVQHSQRAPMRPVLPTNINDDPRSQSMKDMRPGIQGAGGVEEEKLFIGGFLICEIETKNVFF